MEIMPIPIQLLWDEIDTKLAEKMPDKQLLRSVKGCKVLSGWGLMAEICKWYDRLIKQKEKNDPIN